MDNENVCPANGTILPDYEADSSPSYVLIVFAHFMAASNVILLYFLIKLLMKFYKKGMTPQVITEPLSIPRKSISCGPVMRSVGQKPLEHLSAEDLQEIAGDDDYVEQEDVLDYCYGGYKPTEIGEEISHRYTVIRKLGFGHFSTVWLCKDKKNPTNVPYVAVKIVKAAEVFGCVAQDEIKLLRCVMNADPNHAGRNHVIQMLDFFQTHSINGYHTCISFELMGPSLLHLLVQSECQGIQISGVRNIIKQVLEALVYLHEICKIIHTDIKPENILIKVKDSYVRNLVDTSSKYSELGVQMPRTYVSAETWENYLFIRDPVDMNATAGSSKENDNLSRSNSFPIDEDEKCTTPERHDTVKILQQPLYISPNIEVKIADLGNACWKERHFSSNIQTRQYRALEVILGADYGTPADIWSVGCLAFELATAEYLFNPKRSKYLTSTEDHILLICELLGGIPNYIAQRGSAAYKYFDASGNLKLCDDHYLQLHIWKTEDVLVQKYNWKRVDAIPFAALIESMIEPDPELRITASTALNSMWIKDGF